MAKHRFLHTEDICTRCVKHFHMKRNFFSIGLVYILYFCTITASEGLEPEPICYLARYNYLPPINEGELISNQTLVDAINCFNPRGPLKHYTLSVSLQYNYLSPANGGEVISNQTLVEAIKLYQHNFNLPETGYFDAKTRAQMKKPRCGVPDVFPNYGRWKRFAATSGWGRNHITWNVVNYTEDLNAELVDLSIADAFQLWSSRTVLQFERVSGTQDHDVDIRIDFSKPHVDHGDDLPFDGPGHVLAHAFLPWFSYLKGDIHFDDGETWTYGSYSGANLWLVAAHEIGHSLGLQHSFIQGSLMYPYHSGYNESFVLHSDDIEGIEHMYGNGDPPDVVTQKPGPPNGPMVPRLCNESFDAIDLSADGYTFVYKGDYYWRLEDGKISIGYPKRISQGWQGLQSSIDAAVTVKNQILWKDEAGKTYFFKGRAVWRYTNRSLDIGFPKDLSTAFPGFPDSLERINAAVEINGNGQTFFLADGVFYLYTWRRFIEGPYKINAFREIPENIADVMQYKDNYMYFFTKDMNYYQVSPWTFTPSWGFPKPTTADWFECEDALLPLRIGTAIPPGQETETYSNGNLPFCDILITLLMLIMALTLL